MEIPAPLSLVESPLLSLVKSLLLYAVLPRIVLFLPPSLEWPTTVNLLLGKEEDAFYSVVMMILNSARSSDDSDHLVVRYVRPLLHHIPFTQKVVQNLSASVYIWTSTDFEYMCKHGLIDALLSLPQLASQYPKKGRDIANNAIDLAISNGHCEVVKFLMENNINGAGRSYLDWQSIVIACAKGYLDMVKLMSNYGHPLSIHHLAEAVDKGHLELVKWLHVRVHNKQKTITLDIACGNGHLDVTQWLMRHAPKRYTISYSALDLASQNGHLDMVRWLVELPDEMFSMPMNTFDRRESLFTRISPHTAYDAMNYASERGHLAIVKFLHERGYQCSSYAIERASMNNHQEVVEYLLLELGLHCTPNVIHFACMSGHISMIIWLVEHGYGSDDDNDRDKSMLMACENGNLDTVKALMALGYRLPTPNSRAFYFTQHNGHQELVDLILNGSLDRLGAEPDVGDPLHSRGNGEPSMAT